MGLRTGTMIWPSASVPVANRRTEVSVRSEWRHFGLSLARSGLHSQLGGTRSLTAFHTFRQRVRLRRSVVPCGNPERTVEDPSGTTSPANRRELGITGTRIPDLTRYKDRICLGNITDARRHLHRRTEQIVAFLDGFAGMYTDPYTDRGLAGCVI